MRRFNSIRRTAVVVLFSLWGWLTSAGFVLAGSLDQAIACLVTFDAAESSCVTARADCYQVCQVLPDPKPCRKTCDRNFDICFDVAAAGGAFGNPQGFLPCLAQATAEEALLVSDANYLFDLCMSDCAAVRSDCYAQGDLMNPTPASWDQGCASTGVDCTVACFAINPDF